MAGVTFPEMRREVMRALASLAAPDYQQRVWLDPARFENLSLDVHVLFDDTEVLPHPESRVGSVLVAGDEVEALTALAGPLDELLDRLADSADGDYLAAEAWPEICRLAGLALAAMVRSGVL